MPAFEREPGRRHLAPRLAALLLGTVVALAASEVLLRMAGAVPLHRNPLSGFHVAHPKLGWSGERGYSARFRRPDFDVVIANDADGFRLSGVPPDQRGGAEAPRLVFLGDSFTWGWGVPQGAVFTDELQRLLGTSVRVVNRGVNAYGTGQQLLLLEDELARETQPAAVVTVMFCGNDLADNVDDKRGARPWFRLEDGALVRENCPVECRFTGPLRELSRHSVALSFLRYVTNRTAGAVRHTFEASAAERPDEAPPEAVEAPDQSPEERAVFEAVQARQWELERALLREMARRCEEAGSELRVVYVPQVTQVATDNPSLDESRATLAAVCADLGVPYLDPTDRFQEAWGNDESRGPQGQPLFFDHDWHWTAAGHALAGRILAESWDWPGTRD